MSPKCTQRTAGRWVRGAIMVAACLGALVPTTVPTATNEDPWVFISSPDWFNQDVGDLSGATPGVPAAPGWALGVSDGVNGVSPQMLAVQAQLLGAAASHNPRAFLIAGDAVDGIWLTDAAKAMFDPGGLDAGPTIDHAAEIYYGWLRANFASHGLAPLIVTVGDHELGDDPWPAGNGKTQQFTRFKRAFGRHMIDVLDLPASFNGVPTRPPAGPAELMSYAYRLANVLFVSVDVFDFRGPDTTLDPVYGAVVPRADAAHREWLSAVLLAANADATIDHVIVQAHGPALDPVRMRRTSGLMLRDREESGLWQLLRQNDQRRGGKVRLYIAGEVHTPTVVRDPAGDVVQIVHGNPPRPDGDQLGEYSVFTVHPDRIEVAQYHFDLYADGSSHYWSPRTPTGSLATGVSGASGTRPVGTLDLDYRDGATKVAGTGWLTPVDFHGLPILFDFDRRTQSGRFGNAGGFGDLDYEGEEFGGVHTVQGKFGDAVELNGIDAYVATGRGSISEGGTRTVAAWVRLTAGGGNTILSYGWRKDDVNGHFNFRVMNGRLELEIGPSTICRPATTPIVTNGEWRHVAVVLTRPNGNTCEDVRFYVDGEPAGRGSGIALVNTLPWNLYRFGTGYRQRYYFFDGRLDDVAVWHAALDSARLRALVTAADHPALGYDTRKMEQLFALDRAGSGEVTIDDRTWYSATGLDGDVGRIVDDGTRLSIRFDADGTGVATGAEPPPPPPPPPPSAIWEAEEAWLIGLVRFVSVEPGYTGSGYADFYGEGGIEWTVTVPETGTYQLVFRYALGRGDRALAISVDGVTVVPLLNFPRTDPSGSWSVWEEVAIEAELEVGVRTITAMSTGRNGPNVDHLRLGDNGPPPPPPPPEYELLCSADATVDGTDAVCEGGSFTGDLWIYLWPGTAVDEVTFYLDGVLHRVDDLAPWEFDDGAPSGLSVGSHRVTAAVLGEDGAGQEVLADFEVADDEPPPPPPSAIWEAEEAWLIGLVRFVSVEPGYTGSGYADFYGEGGIEWTVTVPETGTYQLVFRYALGRGDRALAISVDGVTVVPLLNFPRTDPSGSWSVWEEVAIEAELEVGVRTITAMSTGRNGPNVDHLRLESD